MTETTKEVLERMKRLQSDLATSIHHIEEEIVEYRKDSRWNTSRILLIGDFVVVDANESKPTATQEKL